jgi:hypothetical protein
MVYVVEVLVERNFLIDFKRCEIRSLEVETLNVQKNYAQSNDRT